MSVKRSYSSDLRRDQSLRTRQKILRAAEKLFLKHGYTQTSMDAIAAAARVSRPTVFVSFGSKSNLLKELVQARVGDAEDAVPQAEWPIFEEMEAEGDPVRILGLQARLAAGIAERAAPIWRVQASVMGADPEMGRVFKELEDYRLAGVTRVIDILARKKGLRRDVKRERLIEGLWMLTAREGYLRAVDKGWSLDDYEAWVRDCSIGMLLGPKSS